MLTKNDLRNIDSLIKKNIDIRVPKIVDARVSKIIDARVPKIIDARVPRIVKAAFQEFYDSIFAPYVEKNETEHKEMISEIKSVGKRLDTVEDYIKDHDGRIEALEITVSSKN